MTDGYRQKLLNWLTSMMALILLTTLMMMHVWFVEIPSDMQFRSVEGLHAFSYLADQLEVFASLLLAILAWHVGDLLRKGRVEHGPAMIFACYGFVLLCLFLYFLTAWFVHVSWLDDLGCPSARYEEETGMPNPFDYYCRSSPAAWKVMLSLGFRLALTAIAIVNLVAGVASFLKSRAKPQR